MSRRMLPCLLVLILIVFVATQESFNSTTPLHIETFPGNQTAVFLRGCFDDYYDCRFGTDSTPACRVRCRNYTDGRHRAECGNPGLGALEPGCRVLYLLFVLE